MTTVAKLAASSQPSTAGEDIELSIVMPCLNEAETLEKCIRMAQRFLETNNVRGEIVIGDNGSTDGSQDIARRCGARVVDVPVRGYGSALYHATLAAGGKYIIMGDSDESYDFSDLMPFLEQLRSGSDVVMGNRFKGGIKPGAMPWKNKHIGNPVLTGIGRMLFQCPVSDFHCGLRGYSADAFRRLSLQTTGMEFASEMVIKATLMRMNLTEVPTTLSPDGRSRPPHLRPWRDGWRHLRFMLLYSPRWLFLYPGLILILLGLLVGAMVLPQPQQIGGTILDVHTLLYAAVAVEVGVQCVLFAALSRAYAASHGLLPPSPRLNRILGVVSLEVGLIAGAVLTFIGVAGAIGMVAYWAAQSFGPLDARVTLRFAIPTVVAVSTGFQIMLASFMLGILQLPTRRPD